MILNSVFKEAVTCNKDEVFDNCDFQSGTVAKQKNTFGLAINGDANVTVRNCNFANKGYSAIYMNSTGEINIENNQIDCTGLYNPIEGGSGANTAKLTKVNIKENVLEGICGNNYFNFYNVEDGSVFNLEDNKVVGMSQQAEVIRLSNLANNSATFNVKNMEYSYDMDTAFDENWTKMILCQDYSQNEVQDFTKYTINLEGTVCNGEAVTAEDGFPVGGLICIYDSYKSFDGTSYPEGNKPVITIK